MIPQEIQLIIDNMLEMGLWKFYLADLGLLIAFISNLVLKKKTKLNYVSAFFCGVLFFFLTSLLLFITLK